MLPLDGQVEVTLVHAHQVVAIGTFGKALGLEIIQVAAVEVDVPGATCEFAIQVGIQLCLLYTSRCV